MGGNIVLNFVRTAIVGVLCLLAWMAVAQYDSFEEKMLEVKGAVENASEQTRKNTALLKELERRLKAGVSVHGGTNGNVEPESDDPRELAYWPTDDNILVDPAGEPAPPSSAPRGGTLNFYIGSNLDKLNVHVKNDADLADKLSAFVYQKIGEQSRANPDNYVGAMANRVTISDDKRVFTIYVRKGNFWHEPALTAAERSGPFKWLVDLGPQEVTAHDIKFTYDVVRSPLSECSNEASYLTDIESLEVIDDYTIQITWKKPRYFNLSSTLDLMFMYPRHIWGRDQLGEELPLEQAAQMFPQHWYNDRMCGSGPFRFVEFQSNKFIRLERHQEYRGVPKPVVDGIVLHIVVDAEVQLQRFKAGELDICRLEPSQYRSEVVEGGAGSIAAMVEKGEVELRKWEGATYYYIAWNQRRPVFRERAVRRAMAHAFPKERVIRDVYAGLAVPHDSPVHHWESAYVKDLERFEFDLEKAGRILDEAGWKPNAKGVREKAIDGRNQELRFKILVVSSRVVYRDFALLFQKELAKIGVILELQVREWNQLTTMLNDKDYDAVSLGWGTSWDSDPEQIWHSRQAKNAKGSNHCSYMSDTVDAAIEGLQVEFDPKKRKALWETFQRTIVGDQPYLFLTIPQRPYAIRTGYGNRYFAKLRPQIWLLPWFKKNG